MDGRSSRSLSRGNWFRFLVAMLFALSMPLSVSLAAMAMPDRSDIGVPAMSCHEPATPASHDNGKSEPSAAHQHLCCFAACIPLAAAAGSAIALSLPVGEPLLTLLSTRPMPRAIGVDLPPPKG